LVRSLTRERRLLQVSLGPLDRQAIAELVQSVAAQADPSRIHAESEGVPLFALEIARAPQQGGASGPASLEHLIGLRLDELEGRAAEALPWAAALGRSFRAELLARTCGIPTSELLVAIGELELRAIIRSAPSAGGGGVFDFVHDLVRQAAYRRISQSRRGLIHLQIARTLASLADPESAMAGDIAHHAALGGDDELCVRACAEAGARCLRLFAHAEAVVVADRGLSRVHTLPRELGLHLEIRLLQIKVRADAWRTRTQELEAEISRVALEAQAAGLFSDVAMALNIVAELHWARGDLTGAAKSSLELAEASRAGDSAARAQLLASGGRCLAQLEQHMPRALAMLEEAKSVSASIGIELIDASLGLGIVRHHLGHHEAAVELLLHAHEGAARSLNHWTDWQCLARLARVELDRNRPSEARSYCTELARLASKMGEGSEGPATEMIEALARRRLGEPEAKSSVERAISRLREIDAKAYLAYALCSVAESDLAEGDVEMATIRAAEAVKVSEAVGRRSDVARGRVILARVALAARDTMAARAQIDEVAADLAKPMEVSERVRAYAAAVVAALVAIEQNL
jgi:tetratricopeptide (TPR) repeat protein